MSGSIKQEVKKKLLARSERVKCIDMHPKEPWMLCSLFSGQVHLWDFEAQNLVKSFEIVDLPVRCVRFIVRMSWFICGSDDMCCRVYNFNTMEKVKVFEAHQDYIRGLAIHDQLPLVLTSSDDMTIKMWDWTKNWQNTMIFEGHTHYVMSVVFNPKDPNTFATASLDRSVKVWNITNATPNFTLEGHEKGVNCVEYYRGGDKPYLISGSDDKTARIWDYQTKCCIQTLSAHSHNLSCVMFHPDLPLIVTGSEDESVKIWQMATYRLETTLDYGLERVWTVGIQAGTNKLAIGCDKGSVVIKLGKDRFVFSMDQNGKIIIAQHSEIQQMNVKTAVDEVVDGEKITLPMKDLGTCENIPKKLEHNPNGQFIAVISEGEYVINTALAWRPKTFGQCISFVWGTETGGYAVLESSQCIKIFKNFKQKKTFKPPGSPDTIFGGPLLCVKADDAAHFFDWEVQERGPIRKIAATPKNIYWNETGELCCLICDTSFFVLRYNRDAVQTYLEGTAAIPEDGIEDAFELVDEIDEKVRSGQWIGDCFLYTNRNQRLNYYIGGETYTLAVLDRRLYFLGYVPKENRVFLADKERNVISYQMHLSVIEYQTAIVRGDLEGAQKSILPRVPLSHRSKIARFLDAQGHKELALEVSEDDEHKFELAIQLKRLEIAQVIAERAQNVNKWKQLGDLAIQYCKFGLAASALKAGEDYNGLLLLYSSTNDLEGLKELAVFAEEKGKNNVAFMAHFLSKNMEGCINTLCSSQRVPHGAIFARSYAPKYASKVVQQWKKDLGSATRIAEQIADPMEYRNLFPELQLEDPEQPNTDASMESANDEEDVREGQEEEKPVDPEPVEVPETVSALPPVPSEEPESTSAKEDAPEVSTPIITEAADTVADAVSDVGVNSLAAEADQDTVEAAEEDLVDIEADAGAAEEPIPLDDIPDAEEDEAIPPTEFNTAVPDEEELELEDWNNEAETPNEPEASPVIPPGSDSHGKLSKD
jgi:coatomer subunit beta'